MWYISFTLLALKFIYKKLYGSSVASLYISNNSFLPTTALFSSRKHSKSFVFLTRYTYNSVALTRIMGLMAVIFCVATIVDMLLWRPRVYRLCKSLLLLLKLGSSAKSSTMINIENNLVHFLCFILK